MTHLFSRLSVRTKLFVTNLIVTLAAVFSVGVYSYIQQQRGIESLAGQVLGLVDQKSEDQLGARSVIEANQVDQFLLEVESAVAKASDYVGRLYDQADLLGEGRYWDASTKLVPLALNQLDNPNDEPGSVLVPSRSPLTPELAQDLNIAKYFDFVAPNLLQANSNLVALYFVHPAGATLYYPNIDLAAVVGDYDPSTRPYYINAAPENNPEGRTIWTTPYQDSAGRGLVVTASRPVYDGQNRFQGVIAVDVQLEKISEAVSTVRLGDSGYAFLIDPQGHVLGMPQRGYSVFDIKPEVVSPGGTPEQTVLYRGPAALQDATDKMRRGGSGVTVFQAPDGVDYYLAYAKVPVANYSLGLIIPVQEMLGPTDAAIAQMRNQTLASAAAGLTLLIPIALVAAIAAYLAARTLTRPLSQLTTTATEITKGNLEAVAPVTTRDEIGVMATAFNTMTGRLRDLIDSLETRVEMRTAQVQASADVGRAATSILDTDRLLQQVAQLITERFGFYYAAVFILDPSGQWAVLREASGPNNAAWLLKQAGHRLELNGNSMVAACIRNRRARIALDTGVEAVRFANPLLPDTHSEVALPLIVGDQVLGALDVQSTQVAAFDETSTAVLQNMADQIAVALNNAAQYHLEQDRAHQTTYLLEATVELTSQNDVAGLYTRIIELTEALLRADCAALWLPVGETELELRIASGPLQAMIGERLIIGEGVAGRVYATSLALRLADVRTWKDASLDFGEAPVRAALATPMTWQGQPIGVLVAADILPDKSFTADDGNMAQLFAAQAASAIENLRLLDRLQHTLNELGRANKRLTGEAWQKRLRDGEISYQHQLTESRELAQPALSVTVPIELRGQAIGQVVVEDDQPQRQLSVDERELVQEVVQRMALALESARLFEQTQSALGEARRLAQRERLINRITAQLRGAVTVDEVLRIAADEMRHSVQAAYAAVKLTPPTDADNGQGENHDSK